MEHVTLEPLGAEVEGLAIADVDTAAARELAALLAERGVVVLREQHAADDAAFVAFLRAFGEPAFTAGETRVDGFPDLNVVSNVGRTTPPRSRWHVDTTYVRRPPAYTALRAVTVPEAGGATLFCDQYRALETLPGDLREQVAGRSILHVVTGVDPGEGAETEAWHPIARQHPVTGRPALYLSTPQRCAEVSELGADDGAELVRRLIEHSTREERVLRHAWAPGDVVIWDNACVMHRADHEGVVGDRVMHRGMVAG